MVERHAVAAKLHIVPAGAHTEDQTPAGDLVHCRRLLREYRRVVEADRRDEWTECDSRRNSRRSGKDRPGIPRRVGRTVCHAVQIVVADPDRVETELLDPPDHRRQLGPADGPLDFGQLHTDPQRTAAVVASRAHARDGIAAATGRIQTGPEATNRVRSDPCWTHPA